MKGLLLLAILFLVVAVTASKAQNSKKIKEPEKESDVMYVVYENSDDDAYKIIGRKLLSEGYQIRRSDKDFYNIQTTMTRRSNYAFAFGMDVTKMNGVVIIRGNAVSSGVEFKPFYGKGKGIMVPVVTFSFMHKFGNQLRRELAGGEVFLASKSCDVH